MLGVIAGTASIIICTCPPITPEHAAGAGALLDHERLAELFLQDVADQARRDVGGTARAERNDDPDRPRRIILGERSRAQGGRYRQRRHYRQREPWARHFHLPETSYCCRAI